MKSCFEDLEGRMGLKRVWVFILILLAYGSLAAGVAIISWKHDCVADAVPLYQYTLVLISPTSEG